MRIKIFWTIVIAVLSVTGYQMLVAGPAHALEIDVISSPEASVEGESITAYIVRIYWFAVGAAGIVAVAVIVGGAIYYMVSSGSPDKQNDAKSYITSALWGVALLLGSYLILNTVNPQITALEPPGGDLPSCSEVSGGRAGIDCLPEVPRALPACTGREGEVEGRNCLPACEEGQNRCGIGQTPGEDNCVMCAPSLLSCPETKFRLASGQDIVCSPNTYKQVFLSGPYIVPNCGNIPPDAYAPGSPKDCSQGMRSDLFNERGVNFSDGIARVAPYYPGGLGPEVAQCIIYTYIPSLGEGEAQRVEAGEAVDWDNARLTGFRNC